MKRLLDTTPAAGPLHLLALLALAAVPARRVAARAAVLTVVAALAASTLSVRAQPAQQQPPREPQRVIVPSLDRSDGQPVALPGLWFAAAAAAVAHEAVTAVTPVAASEPAAAAGPRSAGDAAATATAVVAARLAPAAPASPGSSGSSVSSASPPSPPASAASATSAAPAAAPAVVLLHGCGGAFDRRGRLDARLAAMVTRFNAVGASALVVDSMTPRGETEICTQRVGARRAALANRRGDALGALQWLAAHPGVDATRLGLVGWSNGGSTVLAATNRLHADVAAAAHMPSLAVAFYPGCEADLKRGWQSTTPLLLLVGEADDWTPAPPCSALAAQAASAPPLVAPAIEVYAGAWHGFDGSGPVRLRGDVPNGARPGAGVHVGGDAAARAASVLRLDAFVREQWGLPAAMPTPAAEVQQPGR